MTVGDGTWDTTKNTFLLPNLVGLNFATMRYNGMGNRFAQQPQYHNLIRAHGIIAAITFLAIVPAAILIMRFYTRNPRWALRYHIWLQILTLLLSTVIFVLGWVAVGPSRSLTNPHHGIGLAIYVLVIFQFFGGWWVHRKLKSKKRLYEPLKVMFHHWIGRLVALLGLAQIPLGLTLYGSPLALFVLYALAVFILLVAYFIMTHLQERRRGNRGGNDYDSRYSYGTGSVVEDRRPGRNEGRSGGRTGNVVKGAIAGAGLFALADRFRRRRSKSRVDSVGAPGVGPGGGPEMAGHGRHSSSYVEDEKYSDYSRDNEGDGVWEDRLLRIAAPIGAAGLVTRFFDRRYRDRDSDVEEYGPPLGGAAAINEGRHGEGRLPPGGPVPLNQPLPGNRHPLNQPFPDGQHPLNQSFPQGQRPPNQPLPIGQRPPNRLPSELSYASYESASAEPRRGHGLRDGIATLGVFGLARNIFNRRRGRNEDQGITEEQEARVHGGHLTGDGRPPRHHRPDSSSLSSDTTSLTGINRPHHGNGIPPIPAGAYPAGTAGAAVATHERDRNRNEELPLGGIPRNGHVAMPPIPPDPHGIFHADSSGSEAYIGADGRNHWRHKASHDAAGAVAGGATGLAAAEAAQPSSSRRDQRDRRQAAAGGIPSVSSPPEGLVSVKVKMHEDGRHVTLRRLPEAEAAAEREAREARRRSQERSGRRRGDSASTLSGTDGSGDRFRRNQFQERQQAEAMRMESERLAAARVQAQNQKTAMNVPAPPPIPESSSNLRPPRTASIGSPGTYDGNTTEASADYANNRRRRRAERAQAKQAREAKGGKTVEFE